MAWVINQGQKFYLHDGETLLEGLLRTKQAITFECCQGYCGSCKTKIHKKAGEITHTLPPLCHLEPNEVLACCCQITGVIEIID